MILLFILTVSLPFTLQFVSTTLPNIVFIVADDTGWNDVGFHGSNQIPTPNIDALAYSGTILHNYYTQPICTPSRSALMTGRHPINNGMQHDVIYASEPWGLPLTEKLLPEYLKELGYINRAVGKWHLGFFKRDYTPVYRGFHSHFGYWLGAKDYYTHLQSESSFRGVDFKRNMDPTMENFGTYTTDLFTQEAESIIQNHNKEFPLFLYMAHLATHAPLQAPSELTNSFKNIKSDRRRVFAAMLTKLDESVGRVVAALKDKGILDNSIIVFVSDNGGATHGYNGNVASNWPLRGGKDTLWEGGVRVPAVIWSPLLASAPRIHTGLMSVMDWLPTLISATKETFIPSGNKSIDGHNQWCVLLGDCPVPYDTLLHNIDHLEQIAALRNGSWKIITGSTYKGQYDGWFGNLTTKGPYNLFAVKNSLVAKSTSGTNKSLPDKKTILETRNKSVVRCLKSRAPFKECLPRQSPCLFNVEEDPCEQNNLAETHPDILQGLLLQLKNDYHPVPPGNKPGDPAANPVYWGYNWCNWQDYPPPI